jgi:LuxR family maltose regulon positive regulatory protein
LDENHETLIQQFSGLLQAGAFANNLLFSVYGHIYLAAAFHKTNQGNEAASALKSALDTALPDELYMPFVENYDLIGALLTKALSGKGQKEALSRIEALAKQMQEGCDAVVRENQAKEATFTLSKREYETLSLLNKGLSTEEIAEKMNIAVDTVRKHMKSASKKTGAKGRVALLQKIFKPSEIV